MIYISTSSSRNKNLTYFSNFFHLITPYKVKSNHGSYFSLLRYNLLFRHHVPHPQTTEQIAEISNSSNSNTRVTVPLDTAMEKLAANISNPNIVHSFLQTTQGPLLTFSAILQRTFHPPMTKPSRRITETITSIPLIVRDTASRPIDINKLKFTWHINVVDITISPWKEPSLGCLQAWLTAILTTVRYEIT